jgi:heat shock protein 5
MIANDLGHRITPSWVSFTEDGERLVGHAAKAQFAMNPTQTIYDAKYGPIVNC